jgi:tRNA threonylcarbamoyladenosine biosynthesis protein TsaE
MKITTNSPEETLDLGIKFGKKLKSEWNGNTKIVALFAPMGSGKTLFTRGICIGIGLGDVASSPTFTIMNEYRLQETGNSMQGAENSDSNTNNLKNSDSNTKIANTPPIFHFDMYRIEGDLKDSGLDEYLFENGIIVIEWAENAEKFLPKENVIYVKIRIVDENSREFEFENINNLET